MHLIRKLANTVRSLFAAHSQFIRSSFASLRTLFAAYSQLIRSSFAVHSQFIRSSFASLRTLFPTYSQLIRSSYAACEQCSQACEYWSHLVRSSVRSFFAAFSQLSVRGEFAANLQRLRCDFAATSLRSKKSVRSSPFFLLGICLHINRH